MSKHYPRHWLLLSVLAAGCGNDGTSPPPPIVFGKIAISTTTTGSDPTPYLYAHEVNGSPAVPQLMGSNDRRVLDSEFGAGTFTVELFGLPSNCTAATNPETGLVIPPDTVEVSFAIHCGAADPAEPALVFSSYGSIYELTPTVELYRLNGDGNGLVRLTSNSTANSGGPIWSPDGTRILFSQGPLGADAQLYVMRWDGTNLTQVTHGLQPGNVAWSGDGSRLASFSRGSLWIINADGTGQVSLATPPGDHPAWSADGLRLAFEVQSANGTIAVMNADGTGLSEITDLGVSGEMYRYPTWSPVGSRIVFYNPAFPPACPGCFYITAPAPVGLNIMDPDGSNVVNLGQQGGFGGVSWSSDGTRLGMEGGNSLSIVNTDGSGGITVTIPAVGLNGPPGWAGDGSSLSFLAGNDIYSIHADGTGLTQRSVRSMLEFLSHDNPVWRPGRP